MNSLTFDILSHYIGDCHAAAGIAGLALALESLPKNQAIFQWQKDLTKITVSWKGDFIEAWDYLIQETFKLNDGIIALPSCNLTTHLGLIATLLQAPATRPILRSGLVPLESTFGTIEFNTLILKSFVHQGFAKKLKPKPRISGVELSSSVIPNCSGGLQVTLESAIACLFSPLTWGYYQIKEVVGSKQKFSHALICPDITNLDKIEFAKPCNADQFIAATLADACFDYCDRNSLQQVHGYQYFSKSANRAASIIAAKTVNPFADYAKIRELFPNNWGIDNNDKPFVSANQVRGAIVNNYVKGLRWYEGLGTMDFDLIKFEKEGLQKMLTPQEKWKDKTGFESSDRRKGYRAGYNAASRGKATIPALPDSDWSNGYRDGFNARVAKVD
jgi:hypothetical protein